MWLPNSTFILEHKQLIQKIAIKLDLACQLNDLFGFHKKSNHIQLNILNRITYFYMLHFQFSSIPFYHFHNISALHLLISIN